MTTITADGWLEGVRQVTSPNRNSRPGEDISLLVIHNISLPPNSFGGPYIEALFCNRLDPAAHPYFAGICGLEVSAHCLIDRQGVLTQFVSFADRAWHAGRSSFQGRAECNDYSVGIELEGADDVPYTEPQYRALTAVTRALMTRYPGITPERIVGHSDIAPGRKTDPGDAFDWSRYKHMLTSP